MFTRSLRATEMIAFPSTLWIRRSLVILIALVQFIELSFRIHRAHSRYHWRTEHGSGRSGLIRFFSIFQFRVARPEFDIMPSYLLPRTAIRNTNSAFFQYLAVTTGYFGRDTVRIVAAALLLHETYIGGTQLQCKRVSELHYWTAL